MKKHIWTAFSYTCTSFTVVAMLLNTLTLFGIQPQLNVTEYYQLFIVCVVLSATQVVFNGVPSLDNRHLIRALVNVAELFLLGGIFFGWYGLQIFSIVGGAVICLIAYGSVWLFADFKIRQDAREINEALQKKRQKPPEE